MPSGTGNIIDGVCDNQLLLHIVQRLPRRDICSLAVACRAVRDTLRHMRLVRAPIPFAPTPRLFVACSHSSLLVEVPLSSQDGSGTSMRTWCIGKPLPATTRRSGARSSTRQRSRSHPSWATSVSFHPHTFDLFVCQYSVRGVLRIGAALLPPPLQQQRAQRKRRVAPQQPERRVVAGCKALEGPEGLAFSSNGRQLYVITIDGVLSLLELESNAACAAGSGDPPDLGGRKPTGRLHSNFQELGGQLLFSCQIPDEQRGGREWPLVPWGMVAWPPVDLMVGGTAGGSAEAAGHGAGTGGDGGAGGGAASSGGDVGGGGCAGAAPGGAAAASLPSGASAASVGAATSPGGAAAALSWGGAASGGAAAASGGVSAAAQLAFASAPSGASAADCAPNARVTQLLLVAAELAYDSPDYTSPPLSHESDGEELSRAFWFQGVGMGGGS